MCRAFGEHECRPEQVGSSSGPRCQVVQTFLEDQFVNVQFGQDLL